MSHLAIGRNPMRYRPALSGGAAGLPTRMASTAGKPEGALTKTRNVKKRPRMRYKRSMETFRDGGISHSNPQC